MSSKSQVKITFEEIGGLCEQIKAVKEMVLLPMIYKTLHAKFNMRPPKGVLFHGPPGTGKTLLASALANECSVGDKPVTFFAHKGADILNCYVGESENRLRDVFAKARRSSPSIIFFDEIDALAPSRENLSRGNQVHASLVSVLLTEMDGIGTTGDNIFVIGATNRLEAIDPALRRPGRFDRELRFALPTCEERKQILQVHTSRWKPRVSDELLSILAEKTHGHCGADLCAICSEAFMCCLRRTHPEVASCEQKEHIRKSLLQVTAVDFDCARAKFVPAAHRSADTSVKGLSSRMQPLFQESLNFVIARLRANCPYGYLHGSKFPQHSDCSVVLARLMLTGPSEHMHTIHLAPAILDRFEHLPVTTIDITTLFADSSPSTESACIKAIMKAKAEMPSVLYLPNITGWWKLIDDTTKEVFTSHIHNLSSDMPMLMLVTSNQAFSNIPLELREMFVEGRDVVSIGVPSEAQRAAFFRPLLLDEYLPNMKGSPSVLTTTSTSTTRSSNSDQSGGDCLALRGRAVKRSAPEPAGPASKKYKTPGPSDGAAKEDSVDSSDKWRRKLLERLVAATAGFAHKPLESVYEELSACCARWWRHQSQHQLQSELFACVTAVEVDVASRRNNQ